MKPLLGKKLSRRFFLGSAGVAVSLPMLDAMIPALVKPAKAGSDTPRRLMFIHVPNGMIRTRFTPRDTGDSYTMPALLEPLADVRDQFAVLSGLSNRVGQGTFTYPDGTVSSDGPGDHARDTGTFLTCARLKKTSGDDFENGISVDQVAANHLRTATPEIPSLVLATRSGSYGGDSGYAPIYKSSISWSGTTTPMSNETDPRAVFERLFAGTDPTATAAEIERRNRLEQSVLDSCLDDMASLERELGADDRRKLDEYFQGVRHLETRLAASGVGPACVPGAPPGEVGNFQELVDQMFDVVTLAFQCDRTRVVTLMLDKGGTYDFLGISDGHHAISHLDNGNSDVAKIEQINAWQVEVFGQLIRKLTAATDLDGNTVLDNSLVLFGGGLDGTGHRDDSLTPQASGPVHRHTDLPLLLAGKGGGAVRTGRHIQYSGNPPVANLYLSMLHSVGAMETRFGIEGTEPLGQLV